jgi:hypothetical protein
MENSKKYMESKPLLTWTSKDGVVRSEEINYGNPWEYVDFLKDNGASNISLMVNGEPIDSNLSSDFTDKVSDIQASF